MILIHLDENGGLTAVFGLWEDASRMVNPVTQLPHLFAVSTDGVEMPGTNVFVDPDTRFKELVKEAIREKDFEEANRQRALELRMLERQMQIDDMMKEHFDSRPHICFPGCLNLTKG